MLLVGSIFSACGLFQAPFQIGGSMIEGDIVITPEYWDHGYRIPYMYVGPTRRLWNVHKIEDGTVYLWAVNGHGGTIYQIMPLEDFRREYCKANS